MILYEGTIAYRIENPVNASAATSSMLRLPHRSPSAPVIGADAAEEYVRKPRNKPASVLLPPSARIWNGAVGSSWNADRKTMKLYDQRTKKRGVKSLSMPSTFALRATADKCVALGSWAPDIENDFSYVTTGFHQAMRLSCLRERKRFMDHRRDHALLEQRPHVLV